MRHAGLRALLAISAGILVQHFFHLPVCFLLVYVALTLLAAWFTKGYSLLLALAATSALSLELNTRPVGPVPYYQSARFTGIVLDEPIPNQGSRNMTSG